MYFLEFLLKLITKFFEKESPNYLQNSVIVLDCAQIHKAKANLNLYSILPCDILFNSPYSPQYNFIELVFANLKGKIKSKTYSNTYLKKHQINIGRSYVMLYILQ